MSIVHLKQWIGKYRDIDNELRELNKQIYEKRDTKKGIELEIAGIVSSPQFATYDKLKIDDDGSTIKIKRPETYTKPWSLSMRELQELLGSYFQTHPNANASDCYAYIVSEKKKTLVAKEFSFERTIPDE